MESLNSRTAIQDREVVLKDGHLHVCTRDSRSECSGKVHLVDDSATLEETLGALNDHKMVCRRPASSLLDLKDCALDDAVDRLKADRLVAARRIGSHIRSGAVDPTRGEA